MENVFINLEVDSVNGEVTSKNIDVFFSITIDEAADTNGMDGVGREWMALGENDRFIRARCLSSSSSSKSWKNNQFVTLFSIYKK